eukprot:2729331-Alexandrium_andersonii.AAC.1
MARLAEAKAQREAKASEAKKARDAKAAEKAAKLENDLDARMKAWLSGISRDIKACSQAESQAGRAAGEAPIAKQYFEFFKAHNEVLRNLRSKFEDASAGTL